MMGMCESGSHHAVGAFAREADIQQAISVQVRKFAAPAREANSAVAMAAGSDARKLERLKFEILQGRESLAVKQRGPCQK